MDLFQCRQGIGITYETNPLKVDVNSYLHFCPADLFLVKLRILDVSCRYTLRFDFHLTYPHPPVECINDMGLVRVIGYCVLN